MLALSGELFFCMCIGEPMIVILNGGEVELAGAATLLSLLEGRGISPEVVVAELNGNIVPGSDFCTTTLNDGDHLEVLRFVGGG
jgi:sulfur carrier protein